MKLNLHFIRHRLLIFVFIICCCLTIFTPGYLLVSPPNSSEPLEVLALNSDTDPVFYIASQLTYNHNSFQTLALTDSSSSASSSEPSPVGLPDSPSLPEPSPVNAINAELNLVLLFNQDEIDYKHIINDLRIVSNHFSTISLSVIAEDGVTDKIYLEQYQKLQQELKSNGLSNISMIAYPATTDHLSLYNQDFIHCVGTVLRTQDDLGKLDNVYHYFNNKKMLVVRDEIKATLSAEPQLAATQITKIYYMMAIKYPAISTIFSPCTHSPLTSYEDSYTLRSGDENFNLFYTVYNRLLNQPWITTSARNLSNISPYYSLKDYDTISGTVELILDPNAAILQQLDALISNEYGIYFKWNKDVLNINLNYPYSISINTELEPNGLSRLSVLLQNEKSQQSHHYSIDLNINHPTDVVRSSRITSLSPANHAVSISDNYIPILMYHTIEDEVLPEDQNSHVETKVFESQMVALLENSYTPINFNDLKNYAQGTVDLPEHPILITMDDGYLNNYTNAYPIYKKYNIQATLFVSPYYMKTENTNTHFGWNAAKEMEDSGLIDIQPHGYDHTPFTYLSTKDATYHLSQALGLIEMYLGPRDVNVFAYPQFRHNWRTVNLVNKLDFDFQMTNLVKRGTVLPSNGAFSPPKLKRINVPNTMTPKQLIETLNTLTT